MSPLFPKSKELVDHRCRRRGSQNNGQQNDLPADCLIPIILLSIILLSLLYCVGVCPVRSFAYSRCGVLVRHGVPPLSLLLPNNVLNCPQRHPQTEAALPSPIGRSTLDFS